MEDWRMAHNRRVTRGCGLLEGFLAKKRASLADRFIPDWCAKGGRILDMGCGSYPYHLINSGFSERYGVDKSISERDYESLRQDNIHIRQFNVEDGERLPFDDQFFDVITMLAVLEHIEPPDVIRVLSDVFRLLKKDGVFILTTPPPWTDRLLLIMAGLGLVSAEEIKDHKAAYRRGEITSLLQKAGFRREDIKSGYFEMFLNLWAVGRRTERQG